MSFIQEPPRLGNQYSDDLLLRSYLRRALPEEVEREIRPELERMGELAGGELYRLQLEDRLNEPVLTRWDAWGNRIDRVEVTPLWRRAEELAAEAGLVAIPYERRRGRYARVHQFALVYLFTPSTDIYSCPLAMSDGAVRTLLDSGNTGLIERAVPRLTSRDPGRFWTSGQWMTETTGGSDVGSSETVARRDANGGWRLYGRKWFTSAVGAQMALTLARPEGNGPGGRGLALFYLETRDAEGRLQNLRVERLKEKLGTRKVPTAEIFLEGTPARPVAELHGGVRQIAPMLNVTRLWNGVSAVALMRRGLALAEDFARRRMAFGAPLARQPLHVDTLAGLSAELAGAFHLTFEVVALTGRSEAGELDGRGRALLRALTPVMKLTTAKQAVAVVSEVLESFGGAGYVEDTGLPTLLRDAQVLPIWEGTTNVLALDLLRALEAPEAASGLRAWADRRAAEAVRGEAAEAAAAATAALDAAMAWLERTPPAEAAAGARRFALTVGRALELLLLARSASAPPGGEADERAVAAAARYLDHGVSCLPREAMAASPLLAV